MNITPLHPSLGGLVEGIDCAAPVDTATAEALREALGRWQVLLFRDQTIEAGQFAAFCRAFGDLEILPEPEKRHPEHAEIFNLTNRRADGSLTPKDDPQAVFLRGTSRWHTDSSFREIPCLATVLYALEVPPERGDTEFANMRAAWEGLDQTQQEELASLRAVHSYAYSRAANPDKLKPLSPEELAKVPDTTHPVVRSNADGRRSIYLGGHVSHLAGQPVEQSRAEVRAMEERFTAMDNVYRHQWRAGDLLLWDNRTTLHRLTGYDIARHARSMWRCTVQGTEPVR